MDEMKLDRHRSCRSFRGDGLALLLITAMASACGAGKKTEHSSLRSASRANNDAVALGMTCSADEAMVASPEKILSKSALQNTLRDLFGDNAVAASRLALSTLPNESSQFKFDSAGVSLTQDHVAAYAAVAESVANYMAVSPKRARVMEPCLDTLGTAAFQESCVDDFLSDFGKKTFRRPLTTEEKANFKAIISKGSRGPKTTIAGIGLAVRVMLQSRPFLYLFEEGGEELPGKSGLVKLTPFEYASRLSYFIWNSAPDYTLLVAAEQGKLAKRDEIEAQIRRMLLDKRAQDTMRHFFEQWLGVSNTWQNTYSPAFAGNIGTKDLPHAAYDELFSFVDDVIWNKKGNWSDILTSRSAVVADPEIAKIYGVTAKPGVVQELPADQRSGLLTRSAFLMTGSDTYSPILRGVNLAKNLLCIPLASAPADASKKMSENMAAADPHKAFRERTEIVTADPACMSCHAIINPLGFASGNYDSLGRFSDQEMHVSDGKLVNQTAVDATSKPNFPGAPEQGVNGLVALSDAIAKSPAGNMCFATQLLQYQVGRVANGSDDCSVQAALTAMTAADGSIEDAIVSLAMSTPFTLRKVSAP